MKTVILCGGQGTRIRDVSEVVPKPMLPIGGKPILWHIMKTYAAHGLNDFILCLGYKGWQIKDYFLSYRAMHADVTIDLSAENELTFHDKVGENWKVTLADTGSDTMTGARLFRVRKYLEGEANFCLTYGDGVGDIDIKSLIAFHKGHNKLATLTGVRPSSRFGELLLEGDAITSFNEKPAVSSGWINGGYMVFDNVRVWDYLWPDDSLSLESVPLPAMAKDGQLMTFRHNGFWQPMDTAREFDQLNTLWSSGKAPWKVW